jgi:hypothetical protein
MGIIQNSWDHFVIAERERFVTRAFLSLMVAVMAAVAAFILVGAAAVSAYAVCGDNDSCDSQPWSLGHSEGLFWLLAGLAALFFVISLLRAAVLFGFATRRQ